jgi:hypothetical protein
VLLELMAHLFGVVGLIDLFVIYFLKRAVPVFGRVEILVYF